MRKSKLTLINDWFGTEDTVVYRDGKLLGVFRDEDELLIALGYEVAMKDYWDVPEELQAIDREQIPKEDPTE